MVVAVVVVVVVSFNSDYFLLKTRPRVKMRFFLFYFQELLHSLSSLIVFFPFVFLLLLLLLLFLCVFKCNRCNVASAAAATITVYFVFYFLHLRIYFSSSAFTPLNVIFVLSLSVSPFLTL